MITSQVIEVDETSPKRLPKAALSEAAAQMLWERFPQQLEIEGPSFKTNDQWVITGKGYVGFIPLSPDVGIALRPKVELANIFRMLEVAYRLDFAILEGLQHCESLTDFYERLANVLAKRVLDRIRKGLYRSYVPRQEELPVLRGRLDLRSLVAKPWIVSPLCQYEEHTADIEDNQILLWTLRVILRSGLCSERVLPRIRHAHRALRGAATVTPHDAKACLTRFYHRLNEDYRPMHGLCRFFLEQRGPDIDAGHYSMLPFLVEMPRLFEMYVAEWLKENPPPGVEVRTQSRIQFSKKNTPYFDIDLLLVDSEMGEPWAVADTKYKVPERADPSDVHQVVAYAEATNCKQAFLIYPESLAKPIDDTIGEVRVRTISFALDRDLAESGATFVDELMA